jgi:hypothetical protein
MNRLEMIPQTAMTCENLVTVFTLDSCFHESKRRQKSDIRFREMSARRGPKKSIEKEATKAKAELVKSTADDETKPSTKSNFEVLIERW